MTMRLNTSVELKLLKYQSFQSHFWVIEGGYADIFEEFLHIANEMIFLDLPVEACQKNARN